MVTIKINENHSKHRSIKFNIESINQGFKDYISLFKENVDNEHNNIINSVNSQIIYISEFINKINLKPFCDGTCFAFIDVIESLVLLKLVQKELKESVA